jgi:hypothetical protein
LERTAARLQQLGEVNSDVNRAIQPERKIGGRWLIAPQSGDCNDYAVTKRHELLERGWPSRALLLAEAVTRWGEHHLVLVIRTGIGDLIADNLSPHIRDWSITDYRWVRMQSPQDPGLWLTVAATQVARADARVRNAASRRRDVPSVPHSKLDAHHSQSPIWTWLLPNKSHSQSHAAERAIA